MIVSKPLDKRTVKQYRREHGGHCLSELGEFSPVGNRKMEDMGMKWTSTQIEPEENGIYSCVVEFYKYPHDIKVVNLEYFGEWKITETWNLLMWKKRALD